MLAGRGINKMRILGIVALGAALAGSVLHRRIPPLKILRDEGGMVVERAISLAGSLAVFAFISLMLLGAVRVIPMQ
jgi:hypothetical protein